MLIYRMFEETWNFINHDQMLQDMSVLQWYNDIIKMKEHFTCLSAGYSPKAIFHKYLVNLNLGFVVVFRQRNESNFKKKLCIAQFYKLMFI